MDFSPDGKLLISRALEGYQLWSVPSGEEVKMKGPRFGMLDQLLFSADGRSLVSKPGVVIGGRPYRLSVWDRLTRSMRRFIKVEVQTFLEAYSPDGRIFAGTAWRNTWPQSQLLLLWETDTGGERLRLACPRRVDPDDGVFSR